MSVRLPDEPAESPTCGMVIRSSGGQLLYANSCASAMLGAALAGADHLDPGWRFLGEDGLELSRVEATGFVANDPVLKGRVVGVQSPGGRLRWLQMDVTAVPGEKGSVGRIVSSFVDVTARKLAEQTIRLSEARLHEVLEESSPMMAVFDHRARIQYVSGGVTRALGYNVEDLLGSEAFAAVHPDDREAVRREFLALLEDRAGMRSLRFRALDRWGKPRRSEALLANLLHDPQVGGIVANFREPGAIQAA